MYRRRQWRYPASDLLMLSRDDGTLIYIVRGARLDKTMLFSFLFFFYLHIYFCYNCNNRKDEMKSFGKVKTEENRVFEFKFGILELDNLENLFG